MPIEDWAREEGIADEEIYQRLEAATTELLDKKSSAFPPHIYQIAEKRLLLQTLDQLWKDHLLSLDHLRQGINLRAYAQRDPLNEYKQEAFGLFEYMLNHMREVMMERLSRMQLRIELDEELMKQTPRQIMRESRQDPALAPAEPERPQPMAYHTPLRNHVAAAARNPGDPSTWGKVARNEPCPCGSGKKFKHCHGATT
ncbi:MAG: SEC-C metal-binding domain-containing protein [Alphaproteobacteria bacterium]